MATGRTIIDRAARMIGVKAQGQAMSAEDDAAFLEALNAMLTRWEADGLAMGFSTLASASSTLPVPAEVDEAVAANLAVTMAPEFGRSVTPEVMVMATMGMRALERDVIKPRPVVIDAPVSGGYGYDINSDS